MEISVQKPAKVHFTRTRKVLASISLFKKWHENRAALASLRTFEKQKNTVEAGCLNSLQVVPSQSLAKETNELVANAALLVEKEEKFAEKKAKFYGRVFIVGLAITAPIVAVDVLWVNWVLPRGWLDNLMVSWVTVGITALSIIATAFCGHLYKKWNNLSNTVKEIAWSKEAKGIYNQFVNLVKDAVKDPIHSQLSIHS